MSQVVSSQGIEHFFATKGKYFFYGVLSLGMLVFVVYRFFLPSSDVAIKEYLDVKVDVERLSIQKENKDELLNSLVKSPLAKNYQGVIAQNLAFEGRWDEAIPLAEKVMQKSLPEDSPYTAYSKITILIAKKEYDKALSASNELQKVLDSDPSLTLLSAYNLFRAQVLSEKGSSIDKSSSKLAWDQFRNNKGNGGVINLMEDLFKRGSCCLNDFIKTQLGN